jgi:hypothetical protein
VRSILYKDLVVERTVILIYTAGVILFALQVVPIFDPLALAFCLAIFFTFTTASHEEMNNGHILLNSLPVDRKEVVAAKYAFHLAVGAGFIGLDVLLEAVTGAWSPDLGRQFAFAVLGIIWFVSVFFPLYFWLGHRFVQIAMIFLFIMLVGVVPIVFNLAAKHDYWGMLDAVQTLPNSLLLGLGAVVTAIVFIVSGLLSARLYERKQF